MRKLLILYGTATGNAQEIAERIGREAKRRYFVPVVQDLEHYEKKYLPQENLVVFIVSTTGQGDTPDGMKNFWRFLLRSDLPSNSLNNVSFCVFGLGDTSYVKFNFVAKRLFRRLITLGGTALVDRGDGDESHPIGLEGALIPWLDNMWKEILKLHPIPEGLKIQPANKKPDPIYTIVYQDTSPRITYDEIYSNTNTNVAPFSRNNPYFGKLIQNCRLTKEDWEQDVRHVEFDTFESNFKFNPGDVVCIQPKNPSQEVLNFLELMGINPNLVIQELYFTEETTISSPNDLHKLIKLPCTVKELFEYHLDILGTPNRSFYALLFYFATAEHEIERLEEFTNFQDIPSQDELQDYNFRCKRTVVEVFQEFMSCRPPLEYLLDLIPKIKPREFSISCSSSIVPEKIHITMAVVKYLAKYGREKQGLLSNWIATLNPQESEKNIYLPLWLKKGNISLPSDPKIPLIMVGPGTGCALFRSFIQEKKYQLDQLKKNSNNSLEEYPVGENFFFFGCRHEDKDFMYKDEWSEFVKLGVLKKLECAFSRDSDNGKTYVQHKIRENSKELYELITKKNAHIFVSGNAKRMPTDVQEAFEFIFSDNGETEEKAKEIIRNMQLKKTYVQETWS